MYRLDDETDCDIGETDNGTDETNDDSDETDGDIVFVSDMRQDVWGEQPRQPKHNRLHTSVKGISG